MFDQRDFQLLDLEHGLLRATKVSNWYLVLYQSLKSKSIINCLHFQVSNFYINAINEVIQL